MKPWFVRAKEAMAERGVTQNALAEALDIAQPTVSAKLNGRRDASSSEVASFAAVIGVTASWLAYGDAEEGNRALPEATKEQQKRPSPEDILKALESVLAIANIPMSAVIPDIAETKKRIQAALADSSAVQQEASMPANWGIPNTNDPHGFTFDPHGTDRPEIQPLLTEDIEAWGQKKAKGA